MLIKGFPKAVNMCKKAKLYSVVFFISVFASAACLGASVYFSDALGTGLWSNGGNWTTGSVPGSSDVAVLSLYDAVATVDYAAPNVDMLYLGAQIGSGSLEIVNGGSLTVNGTFDWGYLGNNGYDANLTVSGNGSITFNTNPVIFYHSGAGLTTVTIQDTGLFEINSTAWFHQGTSRIYIEGGIFRADDIHWDTGDNRIEISGDGKLQVLKSVYSTSSANADIAAGRIVCTDYPQISTANVSGTLYTQIAALDLLAENVAPLDNQTDVNPDIILSWTTPADVPGPTYDVYLGTNLTLNAGDLVADDTSANFYDPVPDLDEATDYYWRVDTNYSSTVYTGSTWKFSTYGKVSQSLPQDGAIMVDPNAGLDWIGDATGQFFDVYLGTVRDDVANAYLPIADIDIDGTVGLLDLLFVTQQWLGTPQLPSADLTGEGDVDLLDFAKVAEWWLNETEEFVVRTSGDEVDLGTLSHDTTYYYRVDEINDAFVNSPWQGQVNSFTTIAAPVDYYVSTTGLDTNPGTFAEPFATITKAATVMNAGDTCYVRGGTYHQTATASNLTGLSHAPITFRPYQDEVVLLDGTEAISDIQTSGWVAHSGNIYKTTLTKDIWQLFDDGEMMISARWPNARYDDDSVWQQDATWAYQGTGSSWGTMVTKTSGGQPSLAATGKDFSGAVAVLNLGAFMTHSRIVNSHTAGTETFTYDADYMSGSPLEGMLGGSHFWDTYYLNKGRYYLEAHLNCLDSSKEWFYDTATGTLYFWSPDGSMPSGDIRGKTMNYAVDFDNVEYVTLSGFDFFGCTFKIENATHTTVEDCDLDYFAYSERMVGIEDNWNNMDSTTYTIFQGPSVNANNILRNCTFEYCDGGAFVVEGGNVLVENILMHDIDWTGVGFITVHMDRSDYSTTRRLTAYRTGASEGLQPGKQNIVELCDLGEMLGIMQDDGAAIQVSSAFQNGSVCRNNWVHDNEKFGIRADFNGVPGEVFPVGFGFNATFKNNVCWNQITISYQPPIWVGGDFHNVYNNLSYNNTSIDIVLWGADGANQNSTTRNNAASFQEICWDRYGAYPAPGTVTNNFEGDCWSQIRDYANRDFRPKVGSALVDAGYHEAGITDGFLGSAPDIGPYEYGCQDRHRPDLAGRMAGNFV
jgi:hypothetical protein